MLDIKFIRQNPETVRKAAEDKQTKVDLDQLLALDERKRHIMTELETKRAGQNKRSGEKLGPEEIEALKKLKDKIKILEEELGLAERELNKLLWAVPNLPAADVEIGEGEAANKIIKEWGKIPKFKFQPKDHIQLGTELDLIDVKRAAKISGSRFIYLKNQAVLLEFALVQLALEVLLKERFTPLIPPVLIKKSITDKLGYWQAGGNEDYYWVLEDQIANEETDGGFYLVGTAEHSVVPMHKDEIFNKSDLPKRYVAFSTCFRREAGTYGKDMGGLFRVHQFDKVEMVSLTTKENDDKEHDYFLSLEEKLFQKLEIPYRVVKMGSGDLGFPAARKYDIEAWLPGQGKYREVTSTSTTTDFQARRLNIKYRDGSENKFVHILNGTAFAIGRTLVAIMENYQTEQGTIKVPKNLKKYCHLNEIKHPNKIT